jgi:protein-S-isoprenylcysteine O-methyltransferase Ste14
MLLLDSFEKTGNFLFKYRGHLPIILFVLAIPVSFFTPYYSIAKVRYLEISILTFSFVSIVIGLLIRILTVGRRFMQTSGRNRSQQVAGELNTTGMYSLVRHPLYLGNAFIWFGLVCFIENFWFMIVFVFLFWIYYERIMFAEEQFLIKQFGDKFMKWSTDVPTFIPKFKNFVPSKSDFSWRIVFKNEYPGWISTLTSILYLIILKRMVINREITLILSDLYLTLFILIFGLTFKGIKKFTNLFNPMD